MQNDTLKLLIAFKFANFCSFSIGGNLDFINILPKSFKVGGGDQLAQANCQTPFGYFLNTTGYHLGSVTRSGDFLDFEQVFEAFGNN